MTIETKFNINDLVQHKFMRPLKDKASHAAAFEIMDIHANCCYTSAQIFYDCRAIHAVIGDERDERFKRIYDIVDFSPGHPKDREYVRFREDEIKLCDETLLKLIQSQPVK